MRLAHVALILANLPFWIYTIGYSAALGAFFVYFSTAPGLLIDRLGLSPLAFSLVFAIPAVVLIVASRNAVRFVRRWGERGCLVRGMACLLAGGVLLSSAAAAGISTAWSFVAPMCLIAAGISVTCAVTANGALRPFGDVAGTATAIYHCAQGTIVGVAGTLAVLWLPPGTAWPLAAFCAAAAALVIVLSRCLPRP